MTSTCAIILMSTVWTSLWLGILFPYLRSIRLRQDSLPGIFLPRQSGTGDVFKAPDWDFAQIQLNYFDWEFQEAERQYEILTDLGIPVIVMEPARGGRLASLCPEADKLMLDYAPDKSIASWALRFAAGLPNVQVVLSGMSTMEQIIDNVNTFSNFQPLNEEEHR